MSRLVQIRISNIEIRNKFEVRMTETPTVKIMTHYPRHILAIWTILFRTYLKIKILVQYQGGAEFLPAGILKYSEGLKRVPNAEIGPKDYFG